MFLIHIVYKLQWNNYNSLFLSFLARSLSSKSFYSLCFPFFLSSSFLIKHLFPPYSIFKKILLVLPFLLVLPSPCVCTHMYRKVWDKKQKDMEKKKKEIRKASIHMCICTCVHEHSQFLYIFSLYTQVYTHVHMHIYTCRPAYTYTYTHAYTRGCIKYVVDLLGYRVRITAPYPEKRLEHLYQGLEIFNLWDLTKSRDYFHYWDQLLSHEGPTDILWRARSQLDTTLWLSHREQLSATDVSLA